jgi:nicotinamide mononucleotide transporter
MPVGKTKVKNIFYTSKNLFYLELTAVTFGLSYLVFIVLKKPIAWFLGILSSLFYLYIFYKTNLFFQSILQLFYIGLGCYGWWSWKKQIQIIPRSWSVSKHIIIISLGIAITLLLGNKFSLEDQQMPYFDAFIAVFCILATYLTTKIILENWYYWILLNLLSIILFHYNQLYLTELLFFANLLLSVFGLIHWKKTSDL